MPNLPVYRMKPEKGKDTARQCTEITFCPSDTWQECQEEEEEEQRKPQRLGTRSRAHLKTPYTEAKPTDAQVEERDDTLESGRQVEEAMQEVERPNTPGEEMKNMEAKLAKRVWSLLEKVEPKEKESQLFNSGMMNWVK